MQEWVEREWANPYGGNQVGRFTLPLGQIPWELSTVAPGVTTKYRTITPKRQLILGLLALTL